MWELYTTMVFPTSSGNHSDSYIYFYCQNYSNNIGFFQTVKN